MTARFDKSTTFAEILLDLSSLLGLFAAIDLIETLCVPIKESFLLLSCKIFYHPFEICVKIFAARLVFSWEIRSEHAAIDSKYFDSLKNNLLRFLFALWTFPPAWNTVCQHREFTAHPWQSG